MASESGGARVEYLGWGDDLIARAADWIVRERSADLGSLVVAVPGARAGRALAEAIARRAEPGCEAPKVVTAGAMTDVVLSLEGVVADRLSRTLAWERALRGLDASARRKIVSRDPSVFGAWVRLSELLRSLHGELATEGLSFSDALEFDFGAENEGERARWEALSLAQAAYRDGLRELGLQDPHDARWRALEERALREGVELIMVGVADQKGIVREVVRALGDKATSLVFAPEELRGEFDERGGVLAGAWSQRDVPVSLERWHVVDKPVDQAAKAMELIARFEGRFSAEELTVGVCDEEVAPFLERRLNQVGCAARHARGTSAAGTTIARLLDASARYLERPRFPALAVLLRHPDLEPVVSAKCELGGRDSAECLDLYYNLHLPDRVDGEWLRDPEGKGEEVAALHASLDEVFGELTSRERRPLVDWCGPIRAFLETVYQGVELRPEVESERVLASALSLVGGALGEVDALPLDLAGREVSAHEALELTSRALSTAAIAPAQPEQGSPTVELMGWLELPLDDARAVIVTGWNEGQVPESIQGHPFLPESLREVLKLSTNEERLARDVYAATLLAERSDVAFISGRRSLEGEPRLPSRLAFHRPAEECVERAQRMVADPGDGRAAPSTDPLPAPVLPMSHSQPVIESMRVTDFKAFLESPYAFYLRRVLNFETTDDTARELTPMTFGSLTHYGLEKFGQSEQRDSTDAEEIEEVLCKALDGRVLERLGPRPLPAVAIQVEQIKLRYRHFARWQAERARAGWEIRYTEWSPGREGHLLEVCGEEMKVRGFIDRIDYHPDQGWAILDYKTGDTVVEPSHAYSKQKGWKDLQLPLYKHLASGLGLEGEVGLGYVTLPRDTSLIQARMGKWGDDVLADADEVAAEVIRKVRAGDWFVPGKVPRYDPITRAIFGVGLLTGDAEEEGEEGAA
ncbi:MAG: PD-(D/E)XK nuclease family protein [Planctomycetes bacterium]|nr:PD-(D/E)XK nuclease family protein [Planctomycetota bacterium]